MSLNGLRRLNLLYSAQDAVIASYNLRRRCGECISTSLRTGPGLAGTATSLAEPLAAVRHRQGRLIGHMEALGFTLRQEAILQTLTADVVKSSEIEGEKLDADQVRSSIARRLGMDIGALKPADRSVEGIVEMMLDATRHYDQPLTGREALCVACVPVSHRAQWHDQDQGRGLA